MTDRVFIDSNMWIYSLVEAEEEQEKRRIVLELLEELSQRSDIVVSLQAINETHWVLQRKYGIEEERIREQIQGVISISEIIPSILPDYLEAYSLREQYSLSFWDSLIIAAALRSRCHLLYSEDMHHDLVMRGSLRIQNPFKVV